MCAKTPFSSAVKIIFALWLLLLILALWSKIGVVILVSIAFTGLLPFVLGVFWLGISERGKSIRGQFEVWPVRIFAAAVFFVYWAYGQKWAADTINSLFGVDAKYFGITSILLTVLFTPFGVLYREGVIGIAYQVFLGFSVLLGGYYLVYLLLARRVVGRGKKIIYFIVLLFFIPFFLALMMRINIEFKTAVMNFALWADFYENHLCTDPWANQAKGVVFLDGGRILAYFPYSDVHFKVVSCNYQKTF